MSPFTARDYDSQKITYDSYISVIYVVTWESVVCHGSLKRFWNQLLSFTSQVSCSWFFLCICTTCKDNDQLHFFIWVFQCHRTQYPMVDIVYPGIRKVWIIKYAGCTMAWKERIAKILLCSGLQLHIMMSFHFSPQNFVTVFSRHEFIYFLMHLPPHPTQTHTHTHTHTHKTVLCCQKTFIT
jgi:hypothetical protein